MAGPGTMENDKPFKTIEVIDSQTKQVCKIACMSCIRGHRTTSCGIPVCRTKIFWTVKRPGRPSNSCTCRYGATGGCKCVVARAACPHKSKKGEKRSGECRCDEFGRYCCLLEPEHWTALLSLQKPVVTFFSTRDLLEERQAIVNQTVVPLTPTTSLMTSPHLVPSLPTTPGSQQQMANGSIGPGAYHGFPAPMSSTLTPRFGLMGIGAPLGSQGAQSNDVLSWQGSVPPAPRDFNSLFNADPSELGSCCQAASPTSQSVTSPGATVPQPYSQAHALPHPLPLNDIPRTVSMSQLSPAPFDFDRHRDQYFQHQFPGSICQNCGLSGCTCRHCPPIFQNFGTTSWAQCCGRKHARDPQPAPVPTKIARTENYDSIEGLRLKPLQEEPLLSENYAEPSRRPVNGAPFHDGFLDLAWPSRPNVVTEFPDFNVPPDLANHLILPDGTEPLDLSAFLLSDLDRTQHELNGGTPTRNLPDPRQADGAGGGEEVRAGGNGCCCDP